VLAALLATGCTPSAGSARPGAGSTLAGPVSSNMHSSAQAAHTRTRTAPATHVAGKGTSRPVSQPATARRGTALALLATLRVKGRAPMTGYTRAAFGPAWTDDNNSPSGHDGIDTRNNILARDLTQVTYRSGSGHLVATGVLHDPYTGKIIHFVRGVQTSLAVQIDHVVALGDAFQTGAQQLSASQRVALANDPLELLAVDGPTNEAKSDGDAATWLPPNKAFRCAYVARQVAVKARYRLWVTPAEMAAIGRVLATCPNQTAPTEKDTRPPATGGHAPVTSAPVTAPTGPAGGQVSYANCDAVRAAGKAPLHRGDPGYSSKLDRDGDGIACEP